MQPGELPLILVIDDDPDQLALVRIAALRAGGLRILTAESGHEAIVQLQARAKSNLPPPDLVLTDLKMPQMNGVELMQRIRSEENLGDVPVIFLTSAIYNRDRILAHMAGANAFFEKPVLFPEFVNMLKALPAYLPAQKVENGKIEARAAA